MKSILIASIIANAAMAYALNSLYTNTERTNADNTHMLNQRLSVLEVENYIESRQPWRNVIERRGYAEIIVDAANEFGKPPLAVARVAMIESGLDHRAIGDSGKAIGVMQIHAKWWVGTVPFVRTARDLREPQTNIRAGAWILRHYAERCGTEPEKYLACYNGGENPNEQARSYARRVGK
jgi:soluble lytic murein transglycosylase-like protein